MSAQYPAGNPHIDGIKTVYGVPFGQQAFELIARATDAQRMGGVAVHVAMDDAAVAELAALIRFFAPAIDCFEFPAWDCLPYDRVSPTGDLMGRRMAVLAALAARQKDDIKKALIVLTTVNAVVQRVPPHAAVSGANLSIRKGGRIRQEDVVAFLSGNGYERTDTVREAGEFAVRGGIVDLFAPDGGQAVRIDFFGDEVESLRVFDPVTQRSKSHIPALTLSQASEIILTQARIQHFRAAYRDLFGAVVDKDPLYEAVSEGRRYAGMEHWLPLFYDRPLETLMDYAAPALVSFDAHAPQSQGDRIGQVEDFYEFPPHPAIGLRGTEEKGQGRQDRPAGHETGAGQSRRAGRVIDRGAVSSGAAADAVPHH